MTTRARAGLTAVLASCVLVIAGVAMPSAGSEDDGFVPLFDGKSLAGWQVFGGKLEAWAVENGRLVSLGEGGGWLGTDRSYSDFTLKLEFRVTSGSNSGVYLRAPADGSHISRTGLEIQILDETHPRHKDIKDWQRTAAIYHVAAPKPGHNKPVGEWNAMEVVAEGPHVSIKLNGAIVVDDRLDAHGKLADEHPGLKRTEGRLGLQSHNGRVEFRNIRVKTFKNASE
jgi:hypothetical protein